MTSANVLIIEDHFATGDVLRTILHRYGYSVTHVACGEAGIDHIKQHGAGLIILDIGLAGIDGCEVLRQVRAGDKTRDIPVIVFSALADSQRTPELLKIGANECWLKSCTAVSQILDRVSSYVTPVDANGQAQPVHTRAMFG